MSAVWRKRQPEIGPLERDVAEAHERPPGRLLRAQPLGVGLNPRQRHARLHAALHLDERELHVDGGCELGLRAPQLLELDDFAGFERGGRGGTIGRHEGILCSCPGRLHEPLQQELQGCGSGVREMSSAATRPRSGGGRIPPSPDDRIRGVALCKDRRPGGCSWRVAAGARSTRVGRHRRAAALSRRDGRDRSSSDSPLTMGGVTREIGFFEAPVAEGARAARRLSRALRSRRALRRRRADYPDNARRFAMLVRGALEFAARRGAAPAVVHAHDWQAGLAPGLSEDAVRRASGARRHAERLHDSQPRVPGPLRRRLAAAPRPAVELFVDRAARVLGTHQLSEGRHQRRRRHHDGQPHLRGGNPDAGVRLRVRRHPAPPRGRSRRHPERHRHGRVGSGARPVSAGALRRRRSVGKGGREGGRACAVRFAGR